MSGDDGFLSRWAKRKALVRSGAAPEADGTARAGASVGTQAPAAVAPASPAARAPFATTPARTPSAAPTPEQVVEPPALPTMEDVARLTRSSDFGSFVRPGVDPSVSNAAMKKLFSDPRYNVMDGLDTYIGDYNTPDPIPLAMLRKMNQSALLGLFDHEIEAERDAAAHDCADAAVSAADSAADAPPAAVSPSSTEQNCTRVPADAPDSIP